MLDIWSRSKAILTCHSDRQLGETSSEQGCGFPVCRALSEGESPN